MTITLQECFAAIAAWQQADYELRQAKAREAEARATMLAATFPQHALTPLDGTHHFPLNNGWKLRGVFKTNYNVSKDWLPAVLTELGTHGPAGDRAAETAFRYTPELSMTGYKVLMPSLQTIVNKAVTSSPGSVAFDLIEPKTKAKAA